MVTAPSLTQLLRARAEENPDRTIEVVGGRTLTTGDLLGEAERAAAGLAEAGLVPGRPVLLLVRDMEDFLVSFWGVLLASGIPAAVAGPRDGSDRERQRVERAARSLGEPLVVVDRGLGGVRAPFEIIDAGTVRAATPPALPSPTESIALLQMSSGSTRDPRAVVLTHENLLANIRQMAEALPLGATDTKLAWMPLFHDMGLIGGHLVPLFVGMREVRMDPVEAMADPLRWLEVASERRATVLSSTCLGLARATRALDRAQDRRPDLSCVRVVASGAEPLQPAVLRAFSASTGIPESCHLPLYGLAEATLCVAAPRELGVRTRVIDGIERVIVGAALPGTEVRLGDGGEIEVRGPSVTAGYWRDEESTATLLRDGWVRTGDLGVLHNGELVITGRTKDVIIVGGRNLHAADVEDLVERVAGVKPGGAIAVADDRVEPERLAVAVVLRDGADAWRVLPRIAQAVEGEAGVTPLVFAADRVPRTTSGKKRRVELRDRLRSEGLDDIPHASSVALVAAAWQQALGRPVTDLDAHFRDLGGTSLQAVEVMTYLDVHGGVVPDHRILARASTVRSLARLLEQADNDGAPAPPAPSDRDRIAIVSLALSVPGARGPQSLFDLARAFEGGSVPTRIGPAPHDRLMPVSGGFLDDVATFDAARFGISADEAAAMDPQQRLFLTLADEARQRIGLPENELRALSHACGVFVGAGHQAYLEHVLPHVGQDARALPAGTLAGNLLNMIAARVAHVFDLRGPALTIDTACSSSLVAVHLACQSLRAGECSAALVGGVHLNLTPTLFTLFARAGALSPNGRCLPFDGDADGTVPGEGALAMVLVPLALAEARGLPVLAVVRGSAINNDGASLGVMAPNPAAQEAVIRRALAASGVSPADVLVIEAHGTGTRVGDEVERRVLERAYPHGPRRTASKALFGHLMGAAGAAGLARLVGELASGEVGAVSSFGFGGTNAHVVVEGAWRRVTAAGLTDGETRGERYWLPEAASVLRPGALVLVTGATGALGRALVRRLAPLRPRLVLTGRRAPDASVGDLLAKARSAGGEATYVPADLTTAAGARCVRDVIGRVGAPVDVLFHLAGSLDPANAGALKLGALLRLEALEPRAMVLASSIAASVRGLDHGIEGYAEANRALDDYARAAPAGARVRAVSLPALRGGGMAEPFIDLLARSGVPIANVDDGARMLVEAVDAARAVTTAAAPPSGETVAGSVPGKSVEDVIRELVGAAVGIAPGSLDPDATFASMGLDSLAAIDIVKRIEDLVGRSLTDTFLYEHDTLTRLLLALDGGPAGRLQGIPLLPSQLSFVAQRTFFPDMPGNVMLAATVDDGAAPLTQDELEVAMAALADRHPALSAAIAREDGQHVQLPGAPPEVRFVARLDEATEDAVADEVFDLEHGPLFRVLCDGGRLVLNGHHAVIDAWSMRNVLLELLELLAAARAGRAADLRPLGSTLEEAYAAARSPADPASVAWYRDRFADAPPLHLPWRAPVDAPASGGAGVVRLVLDAAGTSHARDQAAAAGVTLPAWTLAAWMRSLFDESGQHDVVVRCAQGKRTARVADIDRLVGAFADALPVRARATVDDRTADVARRVHAFLAEAQWHGAVSALDLADALPRTAAGPVGLTPVGFSFPLLPDTRVGGFALEDVVGRAGAGVTRATMVAFLVGGRLHLSLSYARSHLGHADAVRLAERTAAHVLDEAPAPEASTLHGRILARCAAHPERMAIDSLTYGALAGRSADLAARLGNVAGARVAVLVAPGHDAVVALLAVLRAGAAYVPLDPYWPDARIAQIASAAEVAALVTTPELAGRAAALAPSLRRELTGATERDDGPLVDDAATAYVMYTSGSTGRPKGVVVSHQACLAFQEWVRRAFGVTERDRFAQTSSLAFGGSVRQIFSALLAGASIHPVSHDMHRDPDALVRFIHDERITIWNSVPSLWVHLMDAAERSELPQPFQHVRCVLIGGEPVPAAQVRRWRQLGSPTRLFNLYGSVETIVNATWFEVVRDPAPDDVHTPIGWPRAGTDVALVDLHGNVGELVVSGAIADGYFADEAATATSFGQTGQRAYRTGDLARRLPDGSFVHMGRKDNQVQVHGNRVELVEIEHTLASHPGVRQSVVLWSGQRLLASVELVPSTDPPPDLRAYLETRLPSFMIPHRIDTSGALPRTPAGKADRLALRAEATAADGVRPALAAAWRAVLNLDADPQDDDDFFRLGGDSINALEVLERVRDQLGGRLRPLILYRYRRFADLCAEVAHQLADTPSPATVAPPEDDGAPFHLSSVQRGFHLAQSATGRSPTWAAMVPLEGPLDVDALRAAIPLLASRHPVLRTRFERTPRGTIEQRVLPSISIPCPLDDLSNLDGTDLDARLEALFHDAAATSFTPEAPPLLTLRLVRTRSRFVLLLASHHIISDGWSCFSLLSELCAAHDAMAARQPISLPTLPRSFRSLIAAEPTRASDEDTRFWRTTLANLPPAPSSADNVRRQLRFDLPRAVLDAIQSEARARGTTPFAVVLSAFAAELDQARSSAEPPGDLIVATAISGRDSTSDDVSRVVGPFARAIPVRLRAPFAVEDVARTLDDAFAHADAPAAALAAAAGPDAHTRLGRFFLSWLDPSAIAPLPSTLRPAWRDSRFHFEAGATRTEVMLAAMPHDEGLTLHLHGGALVDVIAARLPNRLASLSRPHAALIVYAPPGFPIPIDKPVVIETVTCALGRSELVLLPLSADELATTPDLDRHVAAAIAATDAPVIALAGMLPSLLGLGLRSLTDLPGRIVTTGHAATVAAMYLTVERVLSAVCASFRDLHVASLGFGSIGRSTWELCRHLLGEPRSHRILDPRVPGAATSLDGCTLVLAASSTPNVLDVTSLAPGTLVVDDSFPRAFSEEQAWRRMRDRRDVLLVGGGMLDAGTLLRSSPFPDANVVRTRFPTRWLPGCQAEALIASRCPDIGPTTGPVDISRAQAILATSQTLGLRVAPLHLGRELIPADLLTAIRALRTEGPSSSAPNFRDA